jgi:hypothetical protein
MSDTIGRITVPTVINSSQTFPLTTQYPFGLLRIGYLHHQQIIWNKGRAVLTRTPYWFAHEPAWFVRKKNAPWYGKAGENSTVWTVESPKFIMGPSDEEKFDHPTQKPLELMRRPILNHTKRDEAVYDPFLGTGSAAGRLVLNIMAAVSQWEREAIGSAPEMHFTTSAAWGSA